jgi:hypothetical protein
LAHVKRADRRRIVGKALELKREEINGMTHNKIWPATRKHQEERKVLARNQRGKWGDGNKERIFHPLNHIEGKQC